MRSAVERTVTERIPAPPGAVRDHYADLHNLALVHPLIASIDVVSQVATPDGRETTYRISDRVPMGSLMLPVTYTAVMRVPPAGPLRSEARQFPGVRLRSEVSFDPDEDGTVLRERIRISAPWPLLGLTVRRAVDAHTEMLAGIRRHFSG